MSGHGPDFLVIGAQKCGTTWLHQNLQFHPGVWLPPEKELHYWDERAVSELGLVRRALGSDAESQRWRRQVRRQYRRIVRDRSRREHLRWYARYFVGSGDVAWYASLFQGEANQVSGEVTPDYATVEDIAPIRDAFPDLRLVLLIRHPVERIWSQAKMEQRMGGPPAADRAIQLLASPRARAYTDYLRSADHWIDHFGADRLWLGFAEDIAFHPRAVLNSVTDHFGIERHDTYPKAGRMVHKGGHETIPRTTAVRLADALAEEVDELAARLGGPATWWRWSTDALRHGPRTGDLGYPLWDSELANEYADTTGEQLVPRMASGPWSRVHRPH